MYSDFGKYLYRGFQLCLAGLIDMFSECYYLFYQSVQ